jgi:pimeloyl-ACP methyl ester carboxylesterase
MREEEMPLAKIGDIQIYYEEYGEGQALIMILGIGQDTATWEFQISDFSKHFRLILLDNRDSGKSSSCSETYTTETMARDILGLMDHLRIARAHLLGTSMGGMIAQQVALIAPERVISLVMASTTSWGEG